jgi:hypothetical protein
MAFEREIALHPGRMFSRQGVEVAEQNLPLFNPFNFNVAHRE